MSVLQDRVLRFVAGVGVLAAAGAAAAGGAALVASSATVTQPTGSVLAWEIIEPGTYADPFVVGDDTPLEMRVIGVNTGSLPVSVSSSAGGGVWATYPMDIVDGVGRLEMPDGFTGCKQVTINAAGIAPLRTVVSDGAAECPAELIIDVFAEAGVPAGGAPVTTVTDLLEYLRDVSAAADTTENLPAAYQECLKKVNVEAVDVCLASLLDAVDASNVTRGSTARTPGS